MYYAYILESMKKAGVLYRGHTADLKQRLRDHNAGKCRTTQTLRPWRLRFYAGFETLQLAREFEAYLKSGSGHAFSKRRLLE